MKSRFHELASAALDEAIAYYDSNTEGLGDRLLAKVQAAVEYIEDFPEAHPSSEKTSGDRSSRNFRFNLFYALGEAKC